jgi:hypothetical protein
MNYNGRGKLLELYRADSPKGTLYIILVYTGAEYVVSYYIEGSSEWVDGRYLHEWPAAYRVYKSMVELDLMKKECRCGQASAN